MNGRDEKRLLSFPGNGEYGEAAREARVRALKKRVAAGEYRLEAEAIAGAMLDAGVFDTERSAVTPHEVEHPTGMKRAMEHFVVRSEVAEAAEHDSGSATGS